MPVNSIESACDVVVKSAGLETGKSELNSPLGREAPFSPVAGF